MNARILTLFALVIAPFLSLLQAADLTDTSTAETKVTQRRAQWISEDQTPPEEIVEFFRVPEKFKVAFDSYDSPLVFADGHQVKTAQEWEIRRAEVSKA